MIKVFFIDSKNAMKEIAAVQTMDAAIEALEKHRNKQFGYGGTLHMQKKEEENEIRAHFGNESMSYIIRTEE